MYNELVKGYAFLYFHVGLVRRNVVLCEFHIGSLYDRWLPRRVGGRLCVARDI